ncbi:MAG: hypothetical protein CM15mV22_1940 [Eurybiavirus sp.]|nr:MAG: hypothetical protein CM15mV22_1940 [Eurybiavirus sp.]
METLKDEVAELKELVKNLIQKKINKVKLNNIVVENGSAVSNLLIYQGSDFIIDFTIENDNGTVFNLTGYTVACKIKSITQVVRPLL